MGTVPGQPFINPDNVVVALTSSNRGDNADGCFFFASVQQDFGAQIATVNNTFVILRRTDV